MSDSAPARSDDPATPVVAPAVTPAVTPAGTLAVVAVVVAHNGARWAADLGAALADQTRAPDRVVVVDTGSRDDTAEDLRAAFPAAGLVTLDRRTSFGSAIAKGATAGWAGIPGAYGSDQASHASWLWVLHDDCAPAPDALEELLAAAAEDGRIGIVGPKVRDFTDRRHLLEVGLTIARSGRRETGLEPREEDQGQHDDLGSVLAVGSAGMLVRRDVWDQLGGFDPNLPLFRDDVDLGWRANLAGHRVAVAPRAVVHHVQAAARGRRTIDAATRRRHLLDRRGALYVLLANLPGRALWLAYPRLVLASVARSVGFGLGKLPGLAVDELAAVLLVVARPDRVWRARRARRPLRTVPDAAVSRLLAPRGAQVARALESLAGVFSLGSPGSADISARGHRALETGPSDDDFADDEPAGVRWLRRLARPGLVLGVALAVITLVASRDLIGAGRLMGGALLPAPDGASDLWATYVGTWHDVGLGSDTTAPPYLAAMAALATLLAGKAPIAVEVLLLAAVPLAGLTALLAARRLLESPWVRVWAAATYALLPATAGAIAGARLGTSVAAVLLPLLALGAARVVGDGRAPGSWSSAWASGLCLAVMASFVPVSYVIAAALLLVVAVGAARSVAVVARLAVVLVTPVLLLLPWTLELPDRPGLLLLEAGLPGPGLSDAALAPVRLLLQSSGGPGALPWWLGVPLVLGALSSLLSQHRRRLVLAGWATAGTGLAVGLAVSLSTVSTPTAQTAVAAWPGFPVVVVAGGLLLACAVGVERAQDRLRGRSFGWRQPVALGVVGLVVVTPLLLAGWWMLRGTDDPLARLDPVVLPPFVAADGDEPARPRTVTLDRAADGSITYALLRDTGPRLGDAETGPPYESFDVLDEAVGDLVSGRGGDEARVLAEHAVRYLLVTPPVDADLVATIDAVPGLRRLSTDSGAALWRLSQSASRLRLVDADGASLAELPAGAEAAAAELPAGADGRLAVLAERADPRWQATLDGTPLVAQTVDGWAQGFRLPGRGGDLEITYDQTERTRWLMVQAGLVGLVVLLAVPGARRSDVTP